MKRSTLLRRMRALAALTAAAVAAAGCSPGSLGSSGTQGEEVTLSFLVSNSPYNVALAESLAEAFMADHPDVTVEVETRPGGTEGDNLVKTRLSTGDMADVFEYNSGSLLRALNPDGSLVPVTDRPWADGLDPSFTDAVSAGGEVYGAPFGTAEAGAVLYNKAVYKELGLEAPRTWDAFMANNAAIAERTDAAPVIQTYRDTWTSQLFVLGDFHNVLQANPDFPEQYTAGEAKYATSAGLKGFTHLQKVHEAGYLNEDFASAGYTDGLRMLAEGEGVHYPLLTQAIAEIAASHPDALDDIGVFGLPGDDPDRHGITVWMPSGVYVPRTTRGEERKAALEFQAFVAGPEGCDAVAKAGTMTGPYMVDGCELPDEVPPAVEDIQAYLTEDGASSPALEFLSPVKGPNLENLTVEVGSGIRSARDAAALYDRDVAQQAQQLGLDW